MLLPKSLLCFYVFQPLLGSLLLWIELGNIRVSPWCFMGSFSQLFVDLVSWPVPESLGIRQGFRLRLDSGWGARPLCPLRVPCSWGPPWIPTALLVCGCPLTRQAQEVRLLAPRADVWGTCLVDKAADTQTSLCGSWSRSRPSAGRAVWFTPHLLRGAHLNVACCQWWWGWVHIYFFNLTLTGRVSPEVSSFFPGPDFHLLPPVAMLPVTAAATVVGIGELPGAHSAAGSQFLLLSAVFTYFNSMDTCSGFCSLLPAF